MTVLATTRPTPVAAGATRIERIADVAGFEDLCEEWAELLEESPSDRVFLTWEWLHTWWKHLGAACRLDLIAVRQGGELIGLAPFLVNQAWPSRLVPYRTRQFLGTGSVGSDYLDVIVKQGRESEALAALATHLSRAGLALHLAQVNRQSASAVLLARTLARQGWRYAVQPGDVCPFIDLRGHTWTSYLASLDGRHRYNFRHRLDKLAKRFDVRFELVESEAQRREALAALVALHMRRWSARGGSTALYAGRLVAFHEEFSRLALTRGWLRLFVLRLDGRPVAALYGLRYRHAFCFYQTGFDPSYSQHGVGQVTVGLTIKHAIEEGAAEYDLLHGDEAYKFDWARQVRQLGRIELYPPSAHGWLCQRGAALDRAVRRAARRLLPRAAADWVARRANHAVS
jgi:CelD/BcsL family acetyltransferase involved in cellulose biosynthesis